jgi:hypothetical protein
MASPNSNHARAQSPIIGLLFLVSIVAWNKPLLANEPDDDIDRAPLPEPILTETVTDIDGNEAGEVEFEANGSVFRARRGGGYGLDASLEAEWIVHPRFGVRLEPTLAVDRDSALSPPSTDAGVSVGAALKVFQDFERQFFLHAECLARLPWDESPIIQPGDPALPFAVDLRAALRRGALTLRWGVGFGAFGDAEHVPLRASVAAMAPFEASGRLGFWGIELDADGARTAPFVAALNVVPNLVPAGIPFRLGLAIPWAIAERDERPSLGIFVRIFYESAREVAFAEGKHHGGERSDASP